VVEAANAAFWEAWKAWQEGDKENPGRAGIRAALLAVIAGE
jgi:hypothetical protein